MPTPSRFFRLSISAILMAMAVAFFSFRTWETERVIDWDISHYYSYLPATFIYGEYHFDDHTPQWTDAHFRFMPVEDTGYTAKMTAGLAYLYAPFFMGAHAYAVISDVYPADGFSLPYRIGLLASALVFGMLGIWFLSRLLLLFFDEKTAVITTLLIFLGSNMPYYTFVEPLSHVYSFSLACMILYWFFRYLKKQQLKYVIGIGLAAGLLVLVRPVNLVLLLFPVLILSGHKGLSPKVLARHLAVAVLLAFLVWVPQFLYWQHMTGHWLVYSYGRETFFFRDPKVWKGLFSYRKGWFVYSPAMLLLFPGYYFLFRKYRGVAVSGVLTILLAVWVIFSWWCWWYGGGFGARPLIEYLPLVAFPVAALLQYILASRAWVKLLGFPIILFLTGLSVVMNIQYAEGVIHYDSMSKDLYWDQFLQFERSENFWQNLDPADYEAALNRD